MSFAELPTYGPNRDFHSFRNNGKERIVPGMVTIIDILTRGDFFGGAYNGAHQSGDFFGLQGSPNPTAFVTGYDVVASRTNTLKELVCGVAWDTLYESGAFQAIPMGGVGRVLVSGHHPSLRTAVAAGGTVLAHQPLCVNTHADGIGRAQYVQLNATNVPIWGGTMVAYVTADHTIDKEFTPASSSVQFYKGEAIVKLW